MEISEAELLIKHLIRYIKLQSFKGMIFLYFFVGISSTLVFDEGGGY